MTFNSGKGERIDRNKCSLVHEVRRKNRLAAEQGRQGKIAEEARRCNS